MATQVGKLNYNQEKVVGQGSFGTIVYQGFLGLYESDRPVAVKRMQRGKHLDESLFQREVELMQRASDHTNVLRYIRTEMNGDFLFIVTELCSGTLQDYFTNKYQGPRFVSDWEILRQITKGLKYLHELEIVHRDIKPTNILIASYGTKPVMKLADLSVSKVLQADRTDFTNTSVTNPSGSRGWMAPEVYECDRFDFKVDIWALGCIFGYTLAKGNKHPFGEDLDKRVVLIKDKKPMILVTEDLKAPYSKDDVTIKLIQSMLTVDPSRRPTIKRIKKTAFFLFDLERTQKLLDLCDSFKVSVTDDTIAHFQQLVKDKTVDIHAVTQNGLTPLLYLCRYCEHDSLKDLLHLLVKHGSNINVRTQSDGSTPLHLLCQHYEKDYLLELVQLLIDKGADANAKMKNGKTPLLLLCENNKNDNLIVIVQLLIENGADANAKDVNEETPLYLLCWSYEKSNMIDIVELLIEKGADINTKSKKYLNEDYTPLHALCHNMCDNSMDVVQLLIEKGADVNAIKKEGSTPLHLLCKICSHDKITDIVNLLIKKGANINPKNELGCTPLHMLCENNVNNKLVDVARLLIAKGTDLKAKNGNGDTPLHSLCQYNQSDNLVDVARLFIEKGADLNARSNPGNTPLHSLCQYNKSDKLMDVAWLLIENGARLYAKDYIGDSPLHSLCQYNKSDNLVDIVRFLIEKGADVKATGTVGVTPLHSLCRNCETDQLAEIVKFLIEKGADVKAKAMYYLYDQGSYRIVKLFTPLHVLCHYNNSKNIENVFQVLIQKGADIHGRAEDYEDSRRGLTPTDILRNRGIAYDHFI